LQGLGEHMTHYRLILRAEVPCGSTSLRTVAGLNVTVTEQVATEANLVASIYRQNKSLEQIYARRCFTGSTAHFHRGRGRR
jgi:hypothetical protein